MMLKEQLTVVLRENAVLKRAVAIQHERQKEFDERSHEVQSLKQLVLQYQEQVRTLEVIILVLPAAMFLFCDMSTNENFGFCSCTADKQLCPHNAPQAGSAEQLHTWAFQS
jgi:hypothetical protein